MEPIILKQLQKYWIEKESKELMPKQRPKRRYLHFDPVIDKLSQNIINKVLKAEYIKQHAFLPLLHRDQKDRFYKKDSTTGQKKPVTKLRPISYASHFDAIIYSWYSFYLSFYYENLIKNKTVNQSIIAYRSIDKKSNIDFAKEVFDFVKQKGDCLTISLDIKGFYDNIDHQLLKQQWSSLLLKNILPDDHYKVFRSVTKFSLVDLETLKKDILNVGDYKFKLFLGIDILEILRKSKKIIKNPNKYGIPQGTPISCVLSNLYMYDFDLSVESKVKNINGLYRRYSDDIIIVCDKRYEEEMMSFVGAEIEKIKLSIQDNKTEIRYFSLENNILKCTNKDNNISKLQYLGLEFDGQKNYLRHKGYAKFERNMIYAIDKENKISTKYNKPFAKRKIYKRFSYFGKTTFLTYAQKAGDILKSHSIIKQIKTTRIHKKIKQKISKINK